MKPDIELTELLEQIKEKLSCPDIEQLEMYDGEIDDWIVINEQGDLELEDGAKFRVKVGSDKVRIISQNQLQDTADT